MINDNRQRFEGNGPQRLSLEKTVALSPEQMGVSHVVNLRPGMCLVAKYEVLEMLGQGGMGAVYRCRDTTSDIEVAVKTIPPALSHSPAEMEDLKENYQLVSTLIHQNIAVYRALVQDGPTKAYFLVMELVEGVELGDWIKEKRKKGELTFEAIIGILQQVADALDYAHSIKIMHRDIKPGNIMVTPKGMVKVLDFGLAANIHSSMSYASGAFKEQSGTCLYMAPEQWQGLHQGAATDQYALAVVAYEMLAGHRPFENEDIKSLYHIVMTQKPAPIRGVPKYVNMALAKGLAKERNERFASCAEFVRALSGKNKSRGGLTSGYRMMLLVASLVVLLFFIIAFVLSGLSRKQKEPVAEAGAIVEVSNAERLESGKGGQSANGGTSQSVEVEASKEETMPTAQKETAMAGQPENKPPYLVVDLQSGEHRYSANSPDINNDLCRGSELWLRHIPTGTFIMGPFGSTNWARARQRKVTLTRDFYMGIFEVTQKQWSLVRGAEPSYYKSDFRPVEQVSYNDICDGDESFLKRLNDKSSLFFDLPTEAQWEYVCRAGISADEDKLDELLFSQSKSTDYACPELDEIAWYAGNAEKDYELQYGKPVFSEGRDVARDIVGGTHPVGKKLANAWGIYDMYGNVSEWCRDFFETKLGTGEVTDPTGPISVADGKRAVRGTTYAIGARLSRASVRSSHEPTFRAWFLGFRLVCFP